MGATCAPCAREITPGTISDRSSRLTFFGGSAVIFAASAAATIVSCRTMSAMGAIAMPGGWSRSMVWTRMPDQTWLGAGSSFVGMWIVMMLAMMMPSLLPTLWRWRQSVGGTRASHADSLAAGAGAGYFSVWAAIGIAVYAAGIPLAVAELRVPTLARAVPVAGGAIVLIAGALQLTAWKARQLACCRAAPGCGRARSFAFATAWRAGLRLGIDCVRCCAGPMAVLLVLGVADVRAMAAVATAVNVERLSRNGERVARAIGVITVATGLILLTRAAALE